ncbi:hypothetical protein NE237_008498 [Protea cynaroides]|uniref:Uncharacterized protein n=1 Tax=Protea cynaroides TaxID=273540 RepID=A0A9Q0KVT2_9MAGN|nr:hypothetical protein NE237_008498 [Protea cynaroides]
MWQFLLAAAVAGSGFFAQRIFWNGDPSEPTEKSKKQDNEVVEGEEELVPFDLDKPLVPSPCFGSPSMISSGLCRFSESLNCEVGNSKNGEESIFRFSSLDSEGGIESSYGSKGSLKAGAGSHGWKRIDGVKRRFGSTKYVKKSAFTGRYGCVVEEPRKKGRRHFLCLKKRRTSKSATGRRDSCSSTSSTLFSWGLSVGVMYMVSAGKAEINKLNTTVHETAKVVQELQNELDQRKCYRDVQNSRWKSKVGASPRNISCMHEQQLITKSGAEREDINYPKALGLQVTDDFECASGVTEEPEPEALKMDQLEAELESELLKIPWCVTGEASSYEGKLINLGELDPEQSVDIMDIELLDDRLSGPHKPEGIYFNSHQSRGVLPSELDQKLCHLLIEQQESQILELETDLQSSQRKLHEKEAELQALKDTVHHLMTKLSLETASDDETEEAEVQAIGRDWNSCTNSSLSAGLQADGANNMVGKKSIVGMKRAMEFQSCDCHLRENAVSLCGWGCK